MILTVTGPGAAPLFLRKKGLIIEKMIGPFHFIRIAKYLGHRDKNIIDYWGSKCLILAVVADSVREYKGLQFLQESHTINVRLLFILFWFIFYTINQKKKKKTDNLKKNYHPKTTFER